MHEKLLSLARSSNTNATHPGLNKFIRSIKDSQVREIACAWLVKFSPLRKYQIEGNAVFGVETKLLGKYDMGVAALNPYYSMEFKTTSPPPKSTRNNSHQATHQLSTIGLRTVVSLCQEVSSLEFISEKTLQLGTTSATDAHAGRVHKAAV